MKHMMIHVFCAAALFAPLRAGSQSVKVAPDSDHMFAAIPWGSSRQTVRTLLAQKGRKGEYNISLDPWEEGLRYTGNTAEGNLRFTKAWQSEVVVAEFVADRLVAVRVSLAIDDFTIRTRLYDAISRMLDLQIGQRRYELDQSAAWYWEDNPATIKVATNDHGIDITYEKAGRTPTGS